MSNSANLTEIFGTFLAGLGFFFFGVKTVSANFKLMAGRQMRLLATRCTQHAALAGAGGALFAGVTQSVTPITFIVISLVTSGLVEVRKAMPMVVWAGVGTSLMVFLSIINMKLMVLYLIGAAGICYYFERPARARHLVNALVGIGLLFYGLQLMRAGAANLEAWPQFKAALQYARTYSLLLFFAGAAASIIVQSMAAVSIMAITFAKAGLFDVDHTMVAIFGSCFGSGIRVWLLSGGITGTPRQMALLQLTVCVFGGLLSLALYYVESFTGAPLLKSAALKLFGRIESQMAFVYFVMNVLAGTAATAALPWLHRLFDRWSPASTEESLSKPKFIHDHALEDGETALDLVVREQARLFERLPAYFEDVRGNGSGQAGMLSKSNRALGGEVQNFISALIDRHPLPHLSERLIVRLEHGRLVQSLDEALAQFVDTVQKTRTKPSLHTLSLSFAEALDTILLTAAEAHEAGKEDQIEWLLRLTENRSAMMEQVRKNYLTAEAGLSQDDRATLLYLTNLFERTVWLLRQTGKLLARNSGRAQAIPES